MHSYKAYCVMLVYCRYTGLGTCIGGGGDLISALLALPLLF